MTLRGRTLPEVGSLNVSFPLQKTSRVWLPQAVELLKEAVELLPHWVALKNPANVWLPSNEPLQRSTVWLPKMREVPLKNPVPFPLNWAKEAGTPEGSEDEVALFDEGDTSIGEGASKSCRCAKKDYDESAVVPGDGCREESSRKAMAERGLS